MVDVVDKATRSRMMAGIRGKNTRPELFVRSAFHKLGLRYTLSGGGLPGRPDLVFPARRAVVFIHGCFWHKHECSYFKWPTSNVEFWREKITRNAERDGIVKKQLRSLGWRVHELWECHLRATGFSMPNPHVARLARRLRKYKSST